MKEAQVWINPVFIALGTTCAVLSALNTDTFGRAFLASSSAVFLIAAGLLAAHLCHRQNAAMTAELEKDIAAYEQVWGAVEEDPVQAGYVRSLEAKLLVESAAFKRTMASLALSEEELLAYIWIDAVQGKDAKALVDVDIPTLLQTPPY